MLSGDPQQHVVHAGCFFRHSDPKWLKQYLTDQVGLSLGMANEIAQLAENQHYQLACRSYFNARHPGQVCCACMCGLAVPVCVQPPPPPPPTHPPTLSSSQETLQLTTPTSISLRAGTSWHLLPASHPCSTRSSSDWQWPQAGCTQSIAAISKSTVRCTNETLVTASTIDT